jgi:hypothetical protein
MNIKEIIINEAEGSNPSSSPRDNSSSAFKQAADSVGNFTKDVGSSLYNMGAGVVDAGVNTYKGVKNAVTNPEQTKKDFEKWGDRQGEKIDWAIKNPKQAALTTAQTADDMVRAGTNALTFGYADKAAAKANSLLKGTTYDDPVHGTGELQKQYGLSADAKDRSPIASDVGEIGSAFVPFGAFNVGLKGADLLARGVSKALPAVTKAANATRVGRGTGTAVKTVTGLGAGVAADKAAAKGAEKLDPNNPYVTDRTIKEAGWDRATRILARDAENLEGGGGGRGFGSAERSGVASAGSSSRLRQASQPQSAAPSSTSAYADRQQQRIDQVRQNSINRTSSSTPPSATAPRTTTSTPSTPRTRTNPTQTAQTASDAERAALDAAVEKRLADLEKGPGYLKRMGTKIKDTAITTGLTGAGLYGGYKYLLGPAPDAEADAVNQYKQDFKAAYDRDDDYNPKDDEPIDNPEPTSEPQQQNSQSANNPQQTNTSNGSMGDAYKSNDKKSSSNDLSNLEESTNDLKRVKYLIGYRN